MGLIVVSDKCYNVGMKSYSMRIIDGLLVRKLAGAGAVWLKGPKWCGKTTTCEQIAKSAVYMADPKKRSLNLELAETAIDELLMGEAPRLLDEWQDAPQLWDAVRGFVDHAEGVGHFILTGSAVPPDDDKISHTGTGRISPLLMRPMSLWESRESSGSVSLGALFEGGDFKVAKCKDRTLREMAFIVCRGGWPLAVGQAGEIALDRAFDYYRAVVNTDITRADGKIRDPQRVARLMRSYARLQGTQSNLSAIKEDMAANDSSTLDEDTVASYLSALRKIFVVEDMTAWSPKLRLKSVIRTSDTRYFIDPSIAAAALDVGPEDLMEDLRTYGMLFETMAVRDLRVYADALLGSVDHYHDASGLECDAIVHTRHGKYGLVEIKLGGETLVEKGAASLLKLANVIDCEKMKQPSFLMVVTATGDCAYRRAKDGVIVCPLGCLKP